MSPLVALLAPHFWSARNRWRRPRSGERAARTVLFLLAALLSLVLFGASYRIFRHLATLAVAPALGAPLAGRLIEMAFALFFVLLSVSNLTSHLSAAYLDRDLGWTLATPAPPAAVWSARFVLGATRASWFLVAAGVPTFIGYALAFRASPLLYVGLLPLLFLFALAPSGIGAALCVALVRLVPARRAKEATTLVAVVGLSLLLVVLRMLEPERILTPYADPRDVVATLEAVSAPTVPYLPSHWAARALLEAGAGRLDIAALAGLAAAGAAAIGLALATGPRWHLDGWRKAQESARRTRPGPLLERPFERLGADRAAAALLGKELRLFARDPGQWTQALVLLALVVIYAFNMRQLPEAFASRWLRDAVTYLNVVATGALLVAVANRFVFPAVSLEGRSAWFPFSAPVTPGQLLLAKATAAGLPLLVLGLALSVGAAGLLGASRAFVVFTAAAVSAEVCAIVSIGLGLGAIYPRFDLDDPAQVGLTPAGLAFTATGLAYVVLLAAAAAPWAWWALDAAYLPAVPRRDLLVSAAALALVHLAAIAVPLGLGLRRLRRIEVAS